MQDFFGGGGGGVNEGRVQRAPLAVTIEPGRRQRGRPAAASPAEPPPASPR